MSKAIRNLSLLSLFLSPSLSLAFFCPTNFSQIDFGNTMDQVIQTCGKPDAQDEVKKPNENIPQEWSYYIPQTVATQTAGAAQGTLKTQITFDDKGQAINISVNGIGVGSTTICGNTTIQLGATRDQVKAACGDPSFINKQQPSGNNAAAQKETTVTTFIYNSNPPAKLIFENGMLTRKE